MTLKRFCESSISFSQKILVINPDYQMLLEESVSADILQNYLIVFGGKERKDSVFNALQQCDAQTDYVLIHDAVRPMVSHHLIEHVLEETYKHDACIPAIPVRDTIKKSSEDSFVEQTVDRNVLRAVQTPQGYNYLMLKDAMLEYNSLNLTDESQYFEKKGWPVKIVTGEFSNLKITFSLDILLTEHLYGKM